MITTICFQLVSLAFMDLIGVVFYNKKKIDTAENRIFSLMIITNIFGATIDIISTLMCIYIPESIITNVTCKLYLLYLIGYTLIFTSYTIIITRTNYTKEEKLDKYKNISNTILIFYAVISSIVLSIPLYVTRTGYTIYTYGPSPILTYLVCGICMFIWTIELVLHINKLTMRQALPIVVSIIFDASAAIIQFANPEVLIVTAAAVFTTVIMYFVIFAVDNPDLDMIDEIEKAKEEAEQANKSKTEFLSNMSHEIRTPLNAILGFSQGLMEEDINRSAKADVEDIIGASDSLLEIVNEILDISKIESNKLEIVNVDYSFEKMYKYLITLTEGRIGSRQLQFIHSVDNRIPKVLYGDYVRIKQITTNLLSNAIKYTKEGFVKLKFDYEPIDDNSCWIIISVKDSGIGIKPEEIDKVFSKFEKFEIKENVKIQGTGLGLALTKRLVNLLGGSIKVESKYGEGSTFTVKVKQHISTKTIEQLEAENPTTTRRSFVGHGEKILIVDDNNVNLKVACRLLKSYNLTIDLASSGKECISKTLNNSYDLIMLDDLMPELNGPETLKYLKEQNSYKTPTIALTANAMSGMKEKYISDGFNDYLSKPIDKILLEDLLVKYLGRPEDKPEDAAKQPPAVFLKDLDKKESPTSVEKEKAKEEPVESLDEPKEEILENKEEQPKEDCKGNVEYLKANGVDLDKALELLGDMEMYNETLNDYVAEIDQKMADIKKFYEAEDMPNYAILVHSLKSDSRYIGLTKLGDLAYDHELKSKENDLAYVKEHYNELMEEADKMIKIVKNYAGV